MGHQLDKYRDHFLLLCEAGFVAVNMTDEDSAIKLFKASSMLKPDNMLPKIGIGYLHLMKLELKQACKMFQEVLDKEPNNEMAQTFLGLSLSFTPNEVAKGEKILEKAAQKSKDPAIKNLASDAITFVEKFVKKASAPMHTHPEKQPKKRK